MKIEILNDADLARARLVTKLLVPLLMKFQNDLLMQRIAVAQFQRELTRLDDEIARYERGRAAEGKPA